MDDYAGIALHKIYHRSTKTISFLTLTLLLLFFLLAIGTNTEAQVRCPTIEQITTFDDSFLPSINADGTRVAFISTADITGENPDGNREVFLYDTNSIVQITDTISGGSRNPSINADGTRIAFQSDSDINGGNPDGNSEIYSYDTLTGIFTQITDTMSGDSFGPSINANGTNVAFQSTADLTGENPDGNEEIFLYTGGITQITDTTVGNFSPSINADGTRIAFSSRANFTGGNPDGNLEIYLFNTNTSTFTQITFTTSGSNSSPSINADGTRIAFQSSSDINGGNFDGNTEIYLFDMSTGITQITNTVTGDNRAASINADGTRIAFESTSDIYGGNPEGNEEIYLSDIIGITQVTHETSGNSEQASINADGTRIAFRSQADINGDNPDGNSEIYITNCSGRSQASVANVPTLSEWGLIAMAGLIGIAGFMVLSRKKLTA